MPSVTDCVVAVAPCVAITFERGSSAFTSKFGLAVETYLAGRRVDVREGRIGTAQACS